MTRWKISDIKDLGIHINQEGVGKKLSPSKKKRVTEDDIQKAIKKAKRKVRSSTEEG
jgi:cell division ATPase FtsA